MTTSSVINHWRKEEGMMRRRKKLEMMEGKGNAITTCNDSMFHILKLTPITKFGLDFFGCLRSDLHRSGQPNHGLGNSASTTGVASTRSGAHLHVATSHHGLARS